MKIDIYTRRIVTNHPTGSDTTSTVLLWVYMKHNELCEYKILKITDFKK